MKLPDTLEVTVRGDGRPLPWQFVRVTIQTDFRNDFDLVLGPCDKQGRLNVERSDLLNLAEHERQLFLMDYGHPEVSFTGRLAVRPLGVQSLDRAIAAVELFGPAGHYPPSWQSDLDRARSVLLDGGVDVVSVEATAQPPDVVIYTESADAAAG